MEFLSGLLVITMVHLLAAASPGPDFVLVSQQALNHGKRAGLLCSLGITLGLAIHIAYSIAGLATIIAHSAALLWAIKIIGGCYLLYLGYSGLKSKAASVNAFQAEASLKPALSVKKQVATGILCNALNPKAPIYFVSVFTIVISPDLPFEALLAYGIWMMFLQLLWFSTLTLFLSNPRVNTQFRKFGHWLDRILGGAMMLLGIKVLLNR
jgi:RhtB (resistance to homoserine/threonine) family protein